MPACYNAHFPLLHIIVDLLGVNFNCTGVCALTGRSSTLWPSMKAISPAVRWSKCTNKQTNIVLAFLEFGVPTFPCCSLLSNFWGWIVAALVTLTFELRSTKCVYALLGMSSTLWPSMKAIPLAVREEYVHKQTDKHCVRFSQIWSSWSFYGIYCCRIDDIP